MRVSTLSASGVGWLGCVVGCLLRGLVWRVQRIAARVMLGRIYCFVYLFIVIGVFSDFHLLALVGDRAARLAPWLVLGASLWLGRRFTIRFNSVVGCSVIPLLKGT
jgi:hypothetical protein